MTYTFKVTVEAGSEVGVRETLMGKLIGMIESAQECHETNFPCVLVGVEYEPQARTHRVDEAPE